MAFDYKKEYKEFYQPGKQPGIVKIPSMNYLAVLQWECPLCTDPQYPG